MPKCAAHRHDGQPCGRWVKTTTVCWVHGGASRKVREAGQRRLQREKVHQLMIRNSLPVVNFADPMTELRSEIRRSATMVRWWESRILELAPEALTTIREQTWRKGDLPLNRWAETKQSPDVAVAYRLWLEEREHLVKVSKIAIAAGLAEREVKLVEEQGALMARAVLDTIQQLAALWQLNVAQVDEARKMVAAQLRLLPVRSETG